MRTFVKYRKAGKRWLWYAYDTDSGKVFAFHVEVNAMILLTKSYLKS